MYKYNLHLQNELNLHNFLYWSWELRLRFPHLVQYKQVHCWSRHTKRTSQYCNQIQKYLQFIFHGNFHLIYWILPPFIKDFISCSLDSPPHIAIWSNGFACADNSELHKQKALIRAHRIHQLSIYVNNDIALLILTSDGQTKTVAAEMRAKLKG